MIRQLDDRTLVSGQIAPHEVAGLADQGVTMLVNNRPDGEEPDQPLAARHRSRRRAAGIAYRFVPIIRGIGPADVEAMQQALRESRKAASCSPSAARARARPARCALAQREEGASPRKSSSGSAAAGFDSGPIAHLL